MEEKAKRTRTIKESPKSRPEIAPGPTPEPVRRIIKKLYDHKPGDDVMIKGDEYHITDIKSDTTKMIKLKIIKVDKGGKAPEEQKIGVSWEEMPSDTPVE
jgi:hypothetical protein